MLFLFHLCIFWTFGLIQCCICYNMDVLLCNFEHRVLSWNTQIQINLTCIWYSFGSDYINQNVEKQTVYKPPALHRMAVEAMYDSFLEWHSRETIVLVTHVVKGKILCHSAGAGGVAHDDVQWGKDKRQDNEEGMPGFLLKKVESILWIHCNRGEANNYVIGDMQFVALNQFLAYLTISKFWKVVRSKFGPETKISGSFFKNRLFLSDPL